MQIYHNHIPRTGGNFVRNSITKKMNAIGSPVVYIRPAEYLFQDLKKENIENANIISGHFGLEPEIILGKEKLLSITTIRNPVDRIVSHFTSNISVFRDLPRYNNESMRSGKDIDMFKRFIRNKKEYLSTSNFQSRWLTNGINHSLDPVDRKRVREELIVLTTRYGWGVDTKEPSYEQALDKIENMFCVGTTENVNGFLAKFDSKIKSQYGVDLIATNLDPKEYKLSNSKRLRDQIDQDDIDIIKELNPIDFKLWEYVTNSYANG